MGPRPLPRERSPVHVRVGLSKEHGRSVDFSSPRYDRVRALPARKQASDREMRTHGRGAGLRPAPPFSGTASVSPVVDSRCQTLIVRVRPRGWAKSLAQGAQSCVSPVVGSRRRTYIVRVRPSGWAKPLAQGGQSYQDKEAREPIFRLSRFLWAVAGRLFDGLNVQHAAGVFAAGRADVVVGGHFETVGHQVAAGEDFAFVAQRRPVDAVQFGHLVAFVGV